MSKASPSQFIGPMKAVPLAADVELRVRGLEDSAQGGHAEVDVWLHRHSQPGVSARALCARTAGFRLPVRSSGMVAYAVRGPSILAAERHAGTPKESNRHGEC